MAFIKVKKLNIGIDKLRNGEGMAPLLKAFGMDEERLKNIPDYEMVYVNTNRIVGVSEVISAQDDEDTKCVKVYFDKDNYWTIEPDETFIRAIEAL